VCLRKTIGNSLNNLLNNTYFFVVFISACMHSCICGKKEYLSLQSLGLTYIYSFRCTKSVILTLREVKYF